MAEVGPRGRTVARVLAALAAALVVCCASPEPDKAPRGTPQSAERSVTVGSATPARGVVLPADLELLDPPIQRQFSGALEALEAALERGGEAAGAAYGELGRLLQAYGYLSEAAASYREAVRLAPDDARWSYYAGRTALALGRWEAAEEAFRRVVAADLGYLPALWGRARVAEELGRTEQARRLYRQILESRPGSAGALAGLGRLALAAGDAEQARDYLERALASQPEAAEIRYGLALAYRELGDRVRARQHLDRIPDLNLLHEPILVEDPLMVALEELRIGARTHDLRALRAAARGRHDLAAVEYRQSLATDPDRVYARYGLALALLELGRPEEAAAELELLLESEPRHAPSRLALARALSLSGRDEAVEEHLRAALELDPGNAETLAELVRLLEHTGRRDEARRLQQAGRP